MDAERDFASDADCIKKVADAADMLIKCFKSGGKVLILGNGGSASDAQHMAAELVVRFEKERKSLPCIALTADTANLTATGNDYSFERVFSRQIESLAVKGDVVIAISTSGNSPNVLEAVRVARVKEAKVISLGGKDGGKLAGMTDIPIIVKNNVTARVQEVHILIIHIICKLIDEAF